MKKMVVFVALVLAFVIGSAQSVSADAAPRPTADLSIVGVEQEYSIDFLIPVTRSIEGEDEEWIEDRIRFDYYKDDYPERLIGYQDDDGFASCTLYSNAPCILSEEGDDAFRLGYFRAPRVFKIAIVTEDDVLIVSEEIKRVLFNAEFTYDLSGVDLSEDAFGVGEVSEELPFIGGLILEFLARILFTIAVELIVLALFFYRKASSFKLVGIVNLISQSLLTLAVMYGYYRFSLFGALGILLVGEIFVYSFEIIVYAKKLKEKSVWRAIVYGLTANTASFLLYFVLLIGAHYVTLLFQQLYLVFAP